MSIISISVGEYFLLSVLISCFWTTLIRQLHKSCPLFHFCCAVTNFSWYYRYNVANTLSLLSLLRSKHSTRVSKPFSEHICQDVLRSSSWIFLQLSDMIWCIWLICRSGDMLARSHLQPKVQIQPPLENMIDIKRKKKCENEVEWLQSSDVDSLKSAVGNPSFLRQKRSLKHYCK